MTRCRRGITATGTACRSVPGTTLVELIVAIGLAVIVIVALWRLMGAGIRPHGAAMNRISHLSALHHVVTRLRHDIRQLDPMSDEPLVCTPDQLVMAVAGADRRSTRVVYRFEARTGRLLRDGRAVGTSRLTRVTFHAGTCGRTEPTTSVATLPGAGMDLWIEIVPASEEALAPGRVVPATIVTLGSDVRSLVRSLPECDPRRSSPAPGAGPAAGRGETPHETHT